MMRRNTTSAEGQALVLVALTLGVLITLIVGVNEVALRQRTQGRVQDSLDQAAALAVAQLDSASLVRNAPALLPGAVEERFRARLQSGLRRVAAATDTDPATLARQAHVTLVASGGRCHGQLVSAPAVCAELSVTLVGALGTYQVTFTTLAQATHRP
jgi:hypothetical protein